MRIRDAEWEAFHCPIPLAWMTPVDARNRARERAWRVALAGVDIQEARRRGDETLLMLARRELEDARAAWAEMAA